MAGDLLLTFNAGSSTVKIGLFETRRGHARRIAKGVLDFRAKPIGFHVVEGPAVFDVHLEAEAGSDLAAVMDETFGWLAKHIDMGRVAAAGHRVVHGGDAFHGPVRLDGATIDAIDALTPLAPLHQPGSVRLIRAVTGLRPDLLQTASFDTAFHRTNPDIVRRFALPRALWDEGVKRYGFHGLSYKYIAGALDEREGETGKVVAAHLGSGASVCAMDGGKSVDSSMGFSTLDGIPMATRCGALDPGVLLHMMGAMGYARETVEDILYHKSGLLGVSGISADSRVLLESDAPEAKEAIAIFTLRIAGEIARLATTIGGLDALVFTAGIGENQPAVRAAVCERLAFSGLALDQAANAANAPLISTADSRVRVHVLATDEEQVIADEAMAVLDQKG
ncbi:acetate/propionate family kinase [Acuticoccus sp. M5D2P5]|uniref:acetate/propionate family kinase n=1 Tax=Acuticoccus kalidii TaxID=2910977 RepID=UPI001F23D240|nr:acetate/propionate family kinase [Acuticoccus kalidii]MCF3936724.1 acetate/propionate family kinase [Acuticoccus kalidii]